MSRVWLVLGSLLAAGCTCGNECNFFERCDGSVLEQCGGVDQMINRKILAIPCVAPNGTCVEESESAKCVLTPATRCDAGTQCLGSVAAECDNRSSPSGWLVGTQCATPDASVAGSCSMDSGVARCGP